MKVLAADKLDQSALDGINALGCDLHVDANLDGDSLKAAIAEHGPDVVIVRSTKVPGEAFAGSPVKVIIRAGAGYNNIDTAAADQHGVAVCNCPGKNAVAVAELAFGLMLSLDRKIPDNVSQFRAREWNKAGFSKARGLKGLTLGLIGMGNISQEMVTRAHAFGMDVIAWSSWLTDEDAAKLGVTRAATPQEIAEKADVVSLHTSLNDQTRGMVDTNFLDKMKPGALLINTARAEIVDEDALKAACAEGKITAGVDVFNDEPSHKKGDHGSSLKDAEGIYVTHHIGASTAQAQEAVAEETVRIVREFKESGKAPNIVNSP